MKRALAGFAIGWSLVVAASVAVAWRALRDERMLGMPGGKCCEEAASPGVHEHDGMIR